MNVLSVYGQTRWTDYGVSDTEHASIENAARMVGHTFAGDRGSLFTVEAVADCRPLPRRSDGAAVRGVRFYPDGRTYRDAGTWAYELRGEVK
jgi:hypothetical protein